MFDHLLPIGSVVLLKDGVKKLMITGIKPVKEDEPDKVYDYIGVIYPEGFIGNEYNFLFNHDSINDVIFRGYENPERKEFIEYLNAASEEEETGKTRSITSNIFGKILKSQSALTNDIQCDNCSRTDCDLRCINDINRKSPDELTIEELQKLINYKTNCSSEVVTQSISENFQKTSHKLILILY